MEQQGLILRELQDLKAVLATVIGTADRVGEDRFSTEALNEAAKLFKKMSIERGDWVSEDDLPKYLGPCPWRAGEFIRKEFDFTSWVKKGHGYRYLKKDLEVLGQELKTHNINLERYKEFLDDKAAFDKKAAKQPAAAIPKSKSYAFPKGVKNITTTEIPKPNPELVRQDLAQLKQAFKDGKYEAYIDIYKGTHAMLKHIYYFQKYLEPGLKRRCQKWCEYFNYANRALELITGKKEKFVVTDPSAIQL
jgi:hypothetical protein